jgi:small redox-active disulfide protein 2
MTIQILGPGCRNCELLAQRVEEAARILGVQYHIEKITDYAEMAKFPIVGTPALVVDGVVRISGQVPTVNRLKSLLA